MCKIERRKRQYFEDACKALNAGKDVECSHALLASPSLSLVFPEHMYWQGEWRQGRREKHTYYLMTGLVCQLHTLFHARRRSNMVCTT